jgi:hypothetical protein
MGLVEKDSALLDITPAIECPVKLAGARRFAALRQVLLEV